jgi:hypothetical protein
MWRALAVSGVLAIFGCTLQEPNAVEAQQTGFCNVHHIAMERRVAKVSFGLNAIDGKTRIYIARHFPNANECWNGGCSPDAKIAREKHFVYVCPACKRAEREWELKHRKSPNQTMQPTASPSTASLFDD